MKRNPNGSLERIHSGVKSQSWTLKPKKAAWIEDIHIEVIEAKRLMEKLRLRSALLVNSPYHMLGKVFNDRCAVKYIPTRYETPDDTCWLLSNRERALVLTEYAKIVWFLLYNNLFMGTS